MNYRELLSLTKNNPKCCSGRLERLLKQKKPTAAITASDNKEDEKSEEHED